MSFHAGGKGITVPKVAFADLTPVLQGEFEKGLSKDQIDLSLTIQNSHASSLVQRDLNTWARIAERTEMHRDILRGRCAMLSDKCDGLEVRVEVAEDALADVHYSRDLWRFACVCLSFVVMVAFIVIAVHR